jgi:hypothetical protein
MPLKRYFTLAEANEALVELRPLVGQMLEIRQELLDLQPELEPILQKVLGNGGGKVATQAVAFFERLEELIERIQQMEVELKDINSGLLDFPSLRGGREVYLCWRYGEDEIRFWHEINAGFAGRQAL